MTWGTPVQSFVFLGLLVFELEPMYATSDGRTTDADHRIMPPRRGHNNSKYYWLQHLDPVRSGRSSSQTSEGSLLAKTRSGTFRRMMRLLISKQ